MTKKPALMPVFILLGKWLFLISQKLNFMQKPVMAF